MAKMKMGSDSKNKHTGSTFDSFLKQEKIELRPTNAELEAAMLKVMETHKNVFMKLKDEEPIPVAEVPAKTLTVHTRETKEIVKHDVWARKGLKLLHKLVRKNDRRDLELSMALDEELASLQKAHALMSARLHELELKKPEEKQVVITKEVEIRRIETKTNKLVLVGLAISLALNMLVLLTK